MASNLNQALGLSESKAPYFAADWPAPKQVKTLISTRHGGVSQAPFDSLNLGAHVGDDPEAVAENRRRIQAAVSVPLAYLNQTHSNQVVHASESVASPLEADAAVDDTGQVACVVMTADCLPVLLCNQAGTVVAAAHAGWRGLAGGVVQNTIAQMAAAPDTLLAYLGPAIGPDAFEVGEDVREAFCVQDAAAAAAFQPIGEGKYLADIYRLARLILQSAGVRQIYGGKRCTVIERDTFFSYRRNGQTGRMVSAIWLEA